MFSHRLNLTFKVIRQRVFAMRPDEPLLARTSAYNKRWRRSTNGFGASR